MATEQNEQTQDLELEQTEQQTAQDTEQAEVSVESLQEQLSKLEENLKTAVSILQPVLLGCLALFVLLLAVSVVGPLSQIIEAL